MISMDLAELVRRCIRVLYISRKPTDKEFEKVAKVAAMGVVVIGLMGVIMAGLFSVIQTTTST